LFWLNLLDKKSSLVNASLDGHAGTTVAGRAILELLSEGGPTAGGITQISASSFLAFDLKF
jgi:hypothetical protein